ncbi:MAG TPA: FAD-dependent monooxygenase [Planctomycetota bacterium]|nr:FAD-dependent monooxygenase [Planctomycetota bacterium]
MHACDCAVIGGGPAGALLSGLLAAAGKSVVLIDDGRPRHAMPEETLLPAALRALEQRGLLAALAGLAATDRLRHGAIWGSDEVVWQGGEQRGLRVVRRTLDAALRHWAGSCGAVVLDGAAVIGALPDAGTGSIAVRQQDGAVVAVDARLFAVATGRAASAQLLPSERVAAGPETAALCLVGDGSPEFHDAAVVEAVADGWLWWMPLSGGGACVALFSDVAELERRGHVRLGDELLAAARGPARACQWRAVQHAVRATARLCVAKIPVLLLGDAAATIDPLASQGVEKALAAADAAAAAAVTALEQPQLRTLALQHHAAWERGLWQAHAATAMAFYGRETRFPGAPFWRARSGNGASPPPASPMPLPPCLQTRADLQAGTALRSIGRRLEAEAGFLLPGSDAAVARVGFVPVAPLLRAFTAPQSLAAGIATAARDPRLYVLPPRAVHDAVAELFRRGFLLASAAPADP